MNAWIKLSISTLVLAVIYAGFDGPAAVAWLGDIHPGYVLLATASGAADLVLGAWRWQRIALVNGVDLRFVPALRVTAESHFFNQGMPSTFGGDAYRIWSLTNRKLAVGDALGCVATDRLIGALALALLVAATQFSLVHYLPDHAATLAIWGAVAAVLAAAAASLVLARRLANRERGPLLSSLAQAIGHLHTLYRQPPDFAAVMLAGVAGHCLLALMFFLLAVSLDVPLSPGQALTVFPTVFLLSMLPVTVAGWGVREALLITALNLFGIAAPAAVALGLGFGICMLVIGIPGALLWLTARRRGNNAGR